MRPHRLLATLGALALTCSLAACSDEPQPIIEATPSTGPTSVPPPSPTPTATPVPDEPESAKDFIRRWQKEAFAMQVSGDTGQYRAMSLECESCDNLATTVDDIYNAGGSVRTKPGEVHDLQKVGGRGRVSIFEYSLRSFPSTVYRTATAKPEQLTGGTRRYQVNVLSRRNELRIVRATSLDPS